jgi:hypothetical protein
MRLLIGPMSSMNLKGIVSQAVVKLINLVRLQRVMVLRQLRQGYTVWVGYLVAVGCTIGR